MNKTLEKFARDYLKENLKKCSEDQQLMFKRLYSHKNLELSINEVVDKISKDKLSWAMTQVERTLEKKEVK